MSQPSLALDQEAVSNWAYCIYRYWNWKFPLCSIFEGLVWGIKNEFGIFKAVWLCWAHSNFQIDSIYSGIKRSLVVIILLRWIKHQTKINSSKIINSQQLANRGTVSQIFYLYFIRVGVKVQFIPSRWYTSLQRLLKPD